MNVLNRITRRVLKSSTGRVRIVYGGRGPQPPLDTTMPAIPTDTKAPSTKLLATELSGKMDAPTSPDGSKWGITMSNDGIPSWGKIALFALLFCTPAMASTYEGLRVDSDTRETAQEVHFTGPVLVVTPTATGQAANAAYVLANVPTSMNWSGILNTPTSYPPSAHTQDYSTITGTPTSWPWGSITGTPTAYSPTAHATTHSSTGTDAITPASIGALSVSGTAAAADTLTTTGTVGQVLTRTPTSWAASTLPAWAAATTATAAKVALGSSPFVAANTSPTSFSSTHFGDGMGLLSLVHGANWGSYASGISVLAKSSTSPVFTESYTATSAPTTWYLWRGSSNYYRLTRGQVYTDATLPSDYFTSSSTSAYAATTYTGSGAYAGQTWFMAQQTSIVKSATWEYAMAYETSGTAAGTSLFCYSRQYIPASATQVVFRGYGVCNNGYHLVRFFLGDLTTGITTLIGDSSGYQLSNGVVFEIRVPIPVEYRGSFQRIYVTNCAGSANAEFQWFRLTYYEVTLE